MQQRSGGKLLANFGTVVSSTLRKTVSFVRLPGSGCKLIFPFADKDDDLSPRTRDLGKESEEMGIIAKPAWQ